MLRWRGETFRMFANKFGGTATVCESGRRFSCLLYKQRGGGNVENWLQKLKKTFKLAQYFLYALGSRSNRSFSLFQQIATTKTFGFETGFHILK
jgi:hypothetical protein